MGDLPQTQANVPPGVRVAAGEDRYGEHAKGEDHKETDNSAPHKNLPYQFTALPMSARYTERGNILRLSYNENKIDPLIFDNVYTVNLMPSVMPAKTTSYCTSDNNYARMAALRNIGD